MHERDRGDALRIREVAIVAGQLLGREHPLVHDGAAGAAGDVESIDRPHRVLDAAPDHVQLALERVSGKGIARHEELTDRRRIGTRALAQLARVARHHAPSEHGVPFVGRDLLDHALAQALRRDAEWEKAHAHAVRAFVGELDLGVVRIAREERMWKLQRHTGAVSGTWIAAGGSAMGQVLEEPERLLQNGMRALAVDVSDRSRARTSRARAPDRTNPVVAAVHALSSLLVMHLGDAPGDADGPSKPCGREGPGIHCVCGVRAAVTSLPRIELARRGASGRAEY